MRYGTSILLLLLAVACGPKADRKQEALMRLQKAPSAVPGMSLEKAVEQVVIDMRAVKRAKPVADGRWYCNRAIEMEAEVYKAGYEFQQEGRTARFGWLVRYDNDKIEAITEFARQVTP